MGFSLAREEARERRSPTERARESGREKRDRLEGLRKGHCVFCDNLLWISLTWRVIEQLFGGLILRSFLIVW